VGAILPLPLSAFVACSGIALALKGLDRRAGSVKVNIIYLVKMCPA
jgi:hypothetical protein